MLEQLEKQTTVGLVIAAIPFAFRNVSSFTMASTHDEYVEGRGDGSTVSYLYRMREAQGTVQVPSKDLAVRSTSRCMMRGKLDKYGLYHPQAFNTTDNQPLFKITSEPYLSYDLVDVLVLTKQIAVVKDPSLKYFRPTYTFDETAPKYVRVAVQILEFLYNMRESLAITELFLDTLWAVEYNTFGDLIT